MSLRLYICTYQKSSEKEKLEMIYEKNSSSFIRKTKKKKSKYDQPTTSKNMRGGTK